MKVFPQGAKLFAAAWLIGVVLSLAGCGDGAEELYETAQFEELQSNKAHARKLYQQILRDHANSPYADKAKQRLAGMGETTD